MTWLEKQIYDFFPHHTQQPVRVDERTGQRAERRKRMQCELIETKLIVRVCACDGKAITIGGNGMGLPPPFGLCFASNECLIGKTNFNGMDRAGRDASVWVCMCECEWVAACVCEWSANVRQRTALNETALSRNQHGVGDDIVSTSPEWAHSSQSQFLCYGYHTRSWRATCRFECGWSIQ